MDDCHARYQHYADYTGHGKNWILAENLPDTEELPSLQEGPSSEREGGEVCGIFSETGRYFLWDALSERLSEQQAG